MPKRRLVTTRYPASTQAETTEPTTVATTMANTPATSDGAAMVMPNTDAGLRGPSLNRSPAHVPARALRASTMPMTNNCTTPWARPAIRAVNLLARSARSARALSGPVTSRNPELMNGKRT